ncbi:DUF7504 family protein [Natronorubrum bangense]|uniref:Uncharacterized protein n=2 Tax=Natronorubrum bangense TaxID=61858 RepID=L9WML8_9EURY|nr:hypothetical protein [Natronorubrum bangense]ELY50714.1 hypothetical protein C494_05035 [Natronorubrum bangense JCM 10635]QCC54393.1 hypothetical protein DV706_07760 [Natronorubrum bangense]
MVSRNALGGESNEERFSNRLSQLKRQGASVLVVGSVRPAQRRHLCRRLLGQATAESRRRVLVSTTGTRHDASELLEGISGSQATNTLIRYATQARGAAASAGDSDTMDPIAPSIDDSPVTTTTLAELGIEISNAIETFDGESNGLAPAELRVGVESLVPLLEEYGTEQVFKFLHLTNGRAKTVDGMIHYHLSMDSDSDTASVLAPLFDIIIELREQNGVPQERWSIADGELHSGWVSVSQS